MTTVKIPEDIKQARAEARRLEAGRTLAEAQKRSKGRREAAFKLALLRQLRGQGHTNK